MDFFFPNMVLFISYYQLILIPLWPVLWDYKVPIFEVPIMGTFTNSDVLALRLYDMYDASASSTALTNDDEDHRATAAGL